MKRTIYEAYNDHLIVQFLDKQECEAYAKENGLAWRVAEQEYTPPPKPSRKPSIIHWINLEQGLLGNKRLFKKMSESDEKNLDFLFRIIQEGKKSKSTDTELSLALKTVLSGMPQPLTDKEKKFLNDLLERNHFGIQVS